MATAIRLLLIGGLLGLTTGLFAQQDNFPGGQDPNNPLQQGVNDTTERVFTVDTSDIFLYYPDNPAINFFYQDTLLADYFLQYDPSRQVDPFLANLGNPGSPHQPLFYQKSRRRGFATGFDQFDRYRLHLWEMPFYQLSQAFTRASFFQGPTQEHIQFELEFARNFGSNTQLMLRLNRMNNLGLYEFQRALNNSFGLGFSYQSNNKRYRAFFTFASNNTEHQDNGGITSIPQNDLGQDTIIPPLEVDVEIQTAETNFTSQAFGFQQHYQLRTARDTSGQPRRAIAARHILSYETATYKFFDAQAAGNATYYYGYLPDIRGIRQFVRHRQLKNYAGLYTYTPQRKEKNGKRSERDRLEAGIEHSWHQVSQEPQDTNLQNLFLMGKWKTRFGAGILLQVNGHLGLLDNAGDYMVDGNLQVSLKKAGKLEAFASQQLFTPNLVQHRLLITQQQIWENDFRKTLETRIGGTYTLPNDQLSVTGSYILINNLIYFDTASMARQTGIPISIPQLQLRVPLRWRGLHLNNKVYWQQPTETTVRIPPLFGEHSFFFEGMLFKQVMLTRIGLNLRWTAPFRANTYFAPTGQFHQQEDELPWKTILDAFLAFKVSKFRFLIRLENVLPPLTQQYYFTTADYPIPQLFIRFGISWEFVD